MDSWFAAIVFLYGLVAGSFLNACIWRIPRHESMWQRSHCPCCRNKIAFYDNIPIVSYLVLLGRCRSCGARISWRYPLLEFGTAILFLGLLWRFGFSWTLMAVVPFLCMLVALIFIDLEHMILPDIITLPGALAGLLLSVWQDPVFYFDPLLVDLVSKAVPVAWQDRAVAVCGSLLGLLIGGGLLWLVAEVYYRLRKMEGLGFGDVKMMAMVGTFLGWKYTLLTIFLGSFSGAILGMLYIRIRKLDLRHQLPFGVFLGLAAIVVLLFGPEMLGWYLDLFQ